MGNVAPIVLGEEAGRIRYAYLGLDDLIENKRISGRSKDLDDTPLRLL